MLYSVRAFGKHTPCHATVTAQDLTTSNQTFAIVAVLAAVVVLVLLAVVAYYKWFYKGDAALEWDVLPPPVAWSYRKFVESPSSWDFRGTKHNRYHFTEWEANTKEFAKVRDMFIQNLGGKDFVLSRITALYNHTLLSNFIGAKKIMDQRLANSPGIFASTGWRHMEETDAQKQQREWVYQRYQTVVKQYSWNSDAKVPLIPALHGTDIGIAQKIAETGFAALSSIDAGFYGKGIYFTTQAMYSLPYISGQSPVIIVSWIIPGNIYPVTEHHKSSQSLMGSALKPGYNAHFVATEPGGAIAQPLDSALIFDELVIAQESQIVPAFILNLEKATTSSLTKRWRASLVQRETASRVSLEEDSLTQSTVDLD